MVESESESEGIRNFLMDPNFFRIRILQKVSDSFGFGSATLPKALFNKLGIHGKVSTHDTHGFWDSVIAIF
jgi:hypothetical protein